MAMIIKYKKPFFDITDFASDFEIKLLDYTLDKIYPCGWDMHRYSKG